MKILQQLCQNRFTAARILACLLLSSFLLYFAVLNSEDYLKIPAPILTYDSYLSIPSENNSYVEIREEIITQNTTRITNRTTTTPRTTRIVQKKVETNIENKLKTILFWHIYTKRPFVKEGSKFTKFECDKATCIVYENKSSLPIDEYDAILFRDSYVEIEDIPRRSPNQRYVLWELESPNRLKRQHGNGIRINDFFNWTMTYRNDSDIVCNRAKIIRQKDLNKIKFFTNRDITKNKTGFAAWVVSHCNAYSGRDALVKELQKYVPVDVYGSCGNYSCPYEHGKRSRDCFNYIEKKYKFYLSFENSLCREYVTEKFFERLNNDILPIAYGLADYELEGPPHSYVDATKFKSVKDLADYLIYLNKTDTAYNLYFRWKSYYSLARADNYWCTLCEKLYTDNKPKSYSNMTDWFIEQANCVEPQFGEYYLRP